VKSISQEIAELRAMDVAPLVEKYTELHGREPRCKNRPWLWRRCAWRLQELRLGGLSATARQRIDELVAELDLNLGTSRTVRGAITKPGAPKVGTMLTREWRGKQIIVRAVDGGFEYQNVVYRSLSAVANKITDSHVSGRAWFGLVERKAAK
jgi:hypothetical protein